MLDFWKVLCVLGFTTTTAITMAVGCYGAVTLAWRGSAPEPEQQQQPSRVNEGLRDALSLTETHLARERERTETARAQLAAKEQEVLRLTGLLDELRRTAILFPRQGELRPEDLIPATNLPTRPAPGIPAAKE